MWKCSLNHSLTVRAQRILALSNIIKISLCHKWMEKVSQYIQVVSWPCFLNTDHLKITMKTATTGLHGRYEGWSMHHHSGTGQIWTHKTTWSFFHSSTVQSLCSLANWSLFSQLASLISVFFWLQSCLFYRYIFTVWFHQTYKWSPIIFKICANLQGKQQGLNIFLHKCCSLYVNVWFFIVSPG